MATHDHAPYVAQAIRSVLDQTFRDFEFLIVDDGSRDDTPRVVEQFDDPRIVFRTSAENRGSAARRNELVEASRGQYIAVQNSDDYWTLDKLARQVEFLDAHPEYAATFSGASFVDADGAPLWRDVPSPSLPVRPGEPFPRGVAAPLLRRRERALPSERHDAEHVCG